MFVMMIVVIGCSHKQTPTHTKGHWGDRSDWSTNKYYVQNYYADSDAHLIGYIKHDANSLSVNATCEFGVPDNKYKDSIGNFETAEDAQNAVETQCAIEEIKE